MSRGEQEPIGVYVLGMHRSGTSALAEVVNLLGVPLPGEGLLEPSPSNPTGYWEHAALIRFNKRLLAALGASWVAPPPVEVLAHSHNLLREHRVVGREVFAAIYRTPQWVWKDPRNCLLLPFWSATLGSRFVVLLTFRDPAEVVLSLRNRGDLLPHAFALALWERYLQAATRLSRGVPVLVVDYGELTGDHPEGVVARIAGFLRGSGIELAGDDAAMRAVASLYPELRRARVGAADRARLQLSPQQRQLADALRHAAAGAPLDEASLVLETPGTEAMLAGARSAVQRSS